MSIFDKTIDKDGPKECCRLDCDDPRKETERYGVVLMMYSMDPKFPAFVSQGQVCG